jgi:hypothetical protein
MRLWSVGLCLAVGLLGTLDLQPFPTSSSASLGPPLRAHPPIVDIDFDAPSSRQMHNSNDLVCQCGAQYATESHFSRHQNRCALVLDTAGRSWSTAVKRKQNKKNTATPAAASSGTRPPKKRRTDHSVVATSSNRYHSLSPPVDDTIVCAINYVITQLD